MFEHVSHRRRVAVVAALTIGILVFSGCAAQTDPAPAKKPTASAAPTESVSPPTPEPSQVTPTATPVEVNLDDPSSWIIDFAGIGPLTMGGDGAAVKQMMTAFTETPYEACPAVAFFARPDFPSVAVVTDSESGLVQHIALAGSVPSSSPRTSRGIGLNSSLDELKVAYPELIYQDVQGRQTFSLAGDQGTWINFAANGEMIEHIDVSTSSVVPKEYCG